MIKTAFAATLTALFTFTAPATAQFTYTPQSSDDVGLYLGTQIWQSEPSGIFGEENTLIDFNLKKEQQFNYFIDVKHPISFLPNARISNTTLDTSGKTTLTQKFYFDDKTFPLGGKVDASFNVRYVDYTFYYELFDNEEFSFELGVTARDLNGDVTVTGVTKSSDENCHDPDINPIPPHNYPCPNTGNTTISSGKIKTDEINPLLYVATNISLPLNHLSVFAKADFLLLSDHTLSDYQVGLSYDLMRIKMMDFNVNFGYRIVKMEFENLNSLYTDLEFKGAFVGMIARF
jgi:outer membrane protein